MTDGSAPGAWRPGADLPVLTLRAGLLAEIRRFFAARGVLEVETPALARFATPDPNLASLTTVYSGPGAGKARRLHLRTSPEYEMKRLLAAGSGPIYQIARSFRNGEYGSHHNPEFTLLEWYRPGFGLPEMMREVAELLGPLLGGDQGCRPVRYLSYRRAFMERLGIDLMAARLDVLRRCADEHGLSISSGLEDDGVDPWRDLLLTHCIEPFLGRGELTFLHHYPASQAALARLSSGDPRVAERFELYVEGVELANGFDELTDEREQRSRFQAENAQRRRSGLEEMPLDERFLAALADGMPGSAGVALGFDRLVMLADGASTLDEVMAFGFDRV